MGSFSRVSATESDLLRIAHFVCDYSPGNILMIGGGCVLSETAGYRRMRGLSDDLDFIANDSGLEAVKKPLCLQDRYRNGEICESGNITYINDILVGFFHKEIRGWQIPEEVFQHPRVRSTSAGNVYMVPAELNIALKIRRGASKVDRPHIYGKDSLDAASIILGMAKQRENFDPGRLIHHILHGVCSDCRLASHGECVASLQNSEKQLFDSNERATYHSVIESCASSLNGSCQKI